MPVRRPHWKPEADTLLETLHQWIPQLRRTIAQRALDRGDLPVITRTFKELQASAPDLIVKPWSAGFEELLLVYIDGLLDAERLTTTLTASRSLHDILKGSGVDSRTETQWGNVVQGYLTGKLLIFEPGQAGARLLDLSKPPHRAIEAPTTEQNVRGPQEAFVETSQIQLTQIRQRLRSPDLAIESMTVGRRLPVTCHIIYLEGLASRSVVDEVRHRLSAITVDSATNATRVGGLIRDKNWALFPTVRYTERVDLAAFEIESGKVAISVAGDPFVILVPVSLTEFYRTSTDYNTVWYDASFIRVIRFLAWLFGLYLPAIYIAVTEVNPSLVAPILLDLVAGSHTGLPFTPLLEVIVMVLVIEILREAAIRLPRVLASTIGTVGAIVVGTSVVKAGFVSPQIIVLMTFTALSLFSVPSPELLASWRLMNWVLLLSGYILGVYGVVLASLWMSIQLVSISSFGTPYLAPLSPWRGKDWRDFLVRLPWHTLIRRQTSGQARDLRWEDAR